MSNGNSDPRGWRIAALVVALAVSLTASAYAIHTKIYCDPHHPQCDKSRKAAAHGDAGAHGAGGHDMAPAHGSTDSAHAPAMHDSAHAPAAGGMDHAHPDTAAHGKHGN